MRKIIIIAALFLMGCSTVTPTFTMPKPYLQSFNIVSKVSGINVSLAPVGAGWTVIIKNETENTIKFLIDESNYVTTVGKSERLIRGATRKIHSDAAQPLFSIPPKAFFNDILIPESMTEYFQTSLYFPPKPGDSNKKAKIYLVFEINGQKKTWITEITYTKQE